MSGGELEELRQQLAALTARVEADESLRAMMDRDLADIKQRMDAQDHLLQALHITQSNHTQRLTRIEDTLSRIETEFRGKLDTIIAMLGRLVPPADGS
jgi:septal ring factor EnvC (AmiA/AmiB activator)